MTEPIDTEAAASAPAGRATAGARLRAAREAAGLSLDAVAQQLKLAPRQVKALEDDDFQRLPGRTFVRGFARNYARFVHLDPDAVLALLPASDSAPALERPSFAAARRPMGEMPVEREAKPSALRWLLPLLLLVGIAAAGFYEYTRQKAVSDRDVPQAGRSAPPATIAPPLATAPAARSPATATTALPNPVSEAPPRSDTSDASTASASPTPAGAAPSSAASTPTAGAATIAAAAPLVLTFKGTSWAEVKDASGRVILQMTGGAGMTQTVTGTPPLELALGNAREVGVTFRGQSLDLAPYTRGSVARVSLR